MHVHDCFREEDSGTHKLCVHLNINNEFFAQGLRDLFSAVWCGTVQTR